MSVLCRADGENMEGNGRIAKVRRKTRAIEYELLNGDKRV